MAGAPFQHAAVFKKEMIRLDCDPEWLGFLRFVFTLTNVRWS
jgi:hypothetical protein